MKIADFIRTATPTTNTARDARQVGQAVAQLRLCGAVVAPIYATVNDESEWKGLLTWMGDAKPRIIVRFDALMGMIAVDTVALVVGGVSIEVQGPKRPASDIDRARWRAQCDAEDGL